MSQYQKLINELCGELDEQDVLSKAMADADEADDDQDEEDDRDGEGDGVKDEDADAEDAESEDEGDGDDEEDEDEDDENEGRLGKSYSLTTEDGEEIEAVDGTELVKSLLARLETNENATTEALQKAVKVIGQQGEMIKSLQGDIKKIGKQGRGRRAVLNVHEKPDLAKSHAAADEGQQTMTPQEVMTKALSAQNEGRLTGMDVAIAESHLNRGSQIPDSLLSKILSN